MHRLYRPPTFPHGRPVPKRRVSLDFETFLVEEGVAVPEAVCLAWREGSRKGVLHCQFDRAEVLTLLVDVFGDQNCEIIAHNALFELGVIVLRSGVDHNLVMTALSQGRVRCTEIRERLLGIAMGCKSPRTVDVDETDEDGEAIVVGRAGIDERTGNPFGASYADCVATYCGVDLAAGKSGPDAWRRRYGQLYYIPCAEWPQEALEYPLSDVEYLEDVLDGQTRSAQNVAGFCLVEHGDHIATEVEQLRAGWALRLMSFNGPTTDPVAFALFEEFHLARVAQADQIAVDLGFARWNKARHKPKKGQPMTDRATWGGWSITKKNLQALILEDFRVRGFKQLPKKLLVPSAQTKFDEIYPDQRTVPMEMVEADHVGTSGDTLVGCENPALKEYGDVQKSKKQMSSFATTLRLAIGGVLVSDPNVLVNTNRTSWRKPNLQTPPKDGGYRECLVAADGEVFVSVDYDAVELCTLGQVHLEMFGSSVLADLINGGLDPHSSLGATILGMDYAKFLAAYKAGDEFIAKVRNAAKAGNFTLPGGGGNAKFADLCGHDKLIAIATDAERMEHMGSKQDLVMAVAKRIREGWMRLYSEEARRRMDVAALTRGDQFFTYHDPVTGFTRGGLNFTAGNNHPFQSRAATGAKRALWALAWACYVDTESILYKEGVTPWLFVHDEVLFRGPEATAAAWGAEAARIMRDAMVEVVPNVKIGAGPAACRRWYKSAKEVYSEDGRLLPWEPWHEEKDEEGRPVWVWRHVHGHVVTLDHDPTPDEKYAIENKVLDRVVSAA